MQAHTRYPTIGYEMAKLPLSAVTIVSVCYKSDALIVDMIASIPAETPIVLVDNGRTNSFASLPKGRNIDIVRLDENLGFEFAAISRTMLVAYLKQCKIYNTRGVAWKES